MTLLLAAAAAWCVAGMATLWWVWLVVDREWPPHPWLVTLDGAVGGPLWAALFLVLRWTH